MNTIREFLDTLNDSELVQIQNLYCDSAGYPDDQIYALDDEFFELCGFSGMKVAQAIFYGDFNYSHDWVSFDGYGNFKTANSPSQLMDFEGITEWIAENPSDFEGCFDELDEIISEIES